MKIASFPIYNPPASLILQQAVEKLLWQGLHASMNPLSVVSWITETPKIAQGNYVTSLSSPHHRVTAYRSSCVCRPLQGGNECSPECLAPARAAAAVLLFSEVSKE